ncbi:MAG: outer membrane protein assembly factor BamB [Pirellulaceae bacterium]|jgi:outer membrane protein assembly factor BamB
MKYFVIVLLTSMNIGLSAFGDSQNWPQFRGVDSRGVAAKSTLAEDWSATENVAWKVDVPGRGWSSPIVWDDKIFLTTVVTEGETAVAKRGLYFGGNRKNPSDSVHHWVVLCLSLKDGKEQWRREVHIGKPKKSLHIKNSYASETPVTDGQHVYAYFGNLGLFCFTMNGEQKWKKEFDALNTRYDWGTAASPTLHDDRIYIVNDNDEDSTLMAIDKSNGNTIWSVARDEKSNWATPFVWENDQRTEIITPGTGKFRSYDIKGNLLYEFGGGSSITIATPYAANGLLYVSSGYVLDRKKPVFALRPGAQGDISLAADETSNQHIAWCQKQAGPYNPSTIVVDDLLYVLYDRGFFACFDAKSGEEVYEKKRIPDGRAFTASPWSDGKNIYCLNEYGTTFVIQAGREFQILRSNSLDKDELCMATPAIASNKLLLRTDTRLYCIESK